MEQIAIKQEFKKRKKRQIVIAMLIVPVVGLLLYVRGRPDSGIFGLNYEQNGFFLMIVVGVALIFSFVNWRCPSCKKYLGRRLSQNHCSNCGVELK